jgi:hypothetical protein
LKLFFLISVLSISVYPQKLDLNTFTNFQDDLFSLNKQLVDYGVTVSPEYDAIITNIRGTYTLALSYYKQILELSFAQNFNSKNAEEKNSDINIQIRLDEWIKAFEDFKADIYYRQKVLFNSKLKKNTEAVILILDKSISELKKNNC